MIYLSPVTYVLSWKKYCMQLQGDMIMRVPASQRVVSSLALSFVLLRWTAEYPQFLPHRPDR